jgi:hypothetical protein
MSIVERYKSEDYEWRHVLPNTNFLNSIGDKAAGCFEFNAKQRYSIVIVFKIFTLFKDIVLM